jgi:hypothetical protein
LAHPLRKEKRHWLFSVSGRRVGGCVHWHGKPDWIECNKPHGSEDFQPTYDLHRIHPARSDLERCFKRCRDRCDRNGKSSAADSNANGYPNDHAYAYRDSNGDTDTNTDTNCDSYAYRDPDTHSTGTSNRLDH